MNFFLLLMALLMALVMAYGMAGVELRYRKIYDKCQNDLKKCRKSVRSPKKHVHWANLLMCQVVFSNCVSTIPPSRLNVLQ
ncbi:hypothetical protein ScPMuIL_003442 [Solemya velum]